jgi:hypothetical protein
MTAAKLSKGEDIAWQHARAVLHWLNSFRAIWSRESLPNFCSVAFLTVVVCLCSCEANLFGPESREIGGGYRLKRADNHNQFALIVPNESGGLIIDEIGWLEPFIAARASVHSIGRLSIQRMLSAFVPVTCSENQIRFINPFR